MHTEPGFKLLQQHFDLVLDVLSDGVYITDHEGWTLYVNSVYERLTGISKTDIIGRNVTELKKDGIFDIALNPDIVKTGQPTTTVQNLQSGQKVVLSGIPVLNQAGEVVLVVTFVRDITVMSRLREQLSDHKELIDRFQKRLQFMNREGSPKVPFIMKSPEMQELMRRIRNVADTDATMLLLGETGVGKDMLARQVHEHSRRNDKPFFKVDCTTIPENLIESELFGYAPGAFSGASPQGKIGSFEMADTGTLFLDEVGELPLSMQAKFLRVLQSQEIQRVGATKVKKVDVRIIAATNRDLEEEVGAGRFRSDLYYRLRVAVMDVPSLRERQGDILPLARFFMEKYAVKFRREIELTKEVETRFRTYKWPGNIRELENLIQSLIVTAQGAVITLRDLPASMRNGDEDIAPLPLSPETMVADNRSLKEIVGDFEKDLLTRALKRHDGSMARVARQFQMDRTTIFRKLKKYKVI